MTSLAWRKTMPTMRAARAVMLWLAWALSTDRHPVPWIFSAAWGMDGQVSVLMNKNLYKMNLTADSRKC